MKVLVSPLLQHHEIPLNGNPIFPFYISHFQKFDIALEFQNMHSVLLSRMKMLKKYWLQYPRRLSLAAS